MSGSRILTLSAFAGALCLSACSTDKTTTTEQTTTATATDTVAAADNYQRNVDTLMTSMPQPSQVPLLLEKSGADFNANLLNPVSKAGNYTTTSGKAAMNLGVYTADMSYLAAYEKAKDAMPYLRASQKLSQTANVANAFPATLEKRFEQNMNNEDSLMAMVDEIMHRANNYLKSSQRNNTASLIMAGSYIEGLYISTGLVENFPKDMPAEARNGVLVHLVRTILEQKQSLGALINILRTGQQDQQTQDLATQLQDLHTRFEKLNMEEQIKNNHGDLILNDATLKDITAKVKDIRSQIVS